MPADRNAQQYGAFLLRLLLGALFVAHLYWKLAIIPGGIGGWYANLLRNGYPWFVPAYVLSAEIAGALLLIQAVLGDGAYALVRSPSLTAAAKWLRREPRV